MAVAVTLIAVKRRLPPNGGFLRGANVKTVMWVEKEEDASPHYRESGDKSLYHQGVCY